MASENMLQTALNILETVVAPSMGELKAHAKVTNANFAHMNEKFEGIEQKVEGVSHRIESVNEKVEGVDRKVASVNEKVEGVNQRFSSVDERMEVHYKGIMSEMQALRAQLDAAYSKQYSDLLARVAVLEAQMQTRH